MLSSNTIKDHLFNMGLGEYDITSVEADTGGDYVKAFLPDLDFSTAFNMIMGNKFYRLSLVDTDIVTGKSLSFKISDLIDGNVVMYRMNIKKEKFGVSASVLVKRIEYQSEVGGKVVAVSFGMLKDIIDRDEEDVDRVGLLGTV